METTANELAVITPKDLAHLTDLEKEIAGYKEKFSGLTIADENDKEGYDEVVKAIRTVRTKRTGLEAERKSVVKPYNDTVKFINEQYGNVTEACAEIEGPLKEKKAAIDDIVKQKEEEEARQAEEKINARVNELIAAGMVFDGNWYAIGDNDFGVSEMTLGLADIRTMSDNQFANTLQMVNDKSQKIAAEKKRLEDIAAKEKADKEAADKAEREEFERKKKAFDDEQAAFKKQQDDLKAQQEKLEADKREAELREKQVEQDRINGIIRHRSAVLTSMGLEYNANGSGSFDYDGQVLIAHGNQIAETDDVAWLDLLDKLKAIISNKKFQAEEFLKKQQEEEQEKLRLQEQERLAGLSDKQKMQEYIDALLAVPVPPMVSKIWKNKPAMVREYITDNRPA